MGRGKHEHCWKHVTQVENDRKWICKYCNRKFSGGATRIEAHLGLGGKGGGIRRCSKYPVAGNERVHNNIMPSTSSNSLEADLEALINRIHSTQDQVVEGVPEVIGTHTRSSVNHQNNVEIMNLSQGYHDGTTTSFSMQSSHNTNLNSAIQFADNTFSLQSQLMSVPHQAQLQRSENGMMLGMPQTATQGFHTASISNSTYRGVEDFFQEDEIRVRSHETIETEDMQHFLRMFNIGSHEHASFNAHENGDPNPSAYKRVVGWLKIKAAMRWSLFVREKAAERRAQLIELDDS